MRVRTKVKLYCSSFGHYATIYLDEIKNMEQNCSYWYIEMKDGSVLKDAEHCVITDDLPENTGYFC